MYPYGRGQGGTHGWRGAPAGPGQSGAGEARGHVQPAPRDEYEYEYDREQAALAEHRERAARRARAARVPRPRPPPPSQEAAYALRQRAPEHSAAVGRGSASYGYGAAAAQPSYQPAAYDQPADPYPYPEGYAPAPQSAFEAAEPVYSEPTAYHAATDPQQWHQPRASTSAPRAGPSQVASRRSTMRFERELGRDEAPESGSRSYNFGDPVPPDVRWEQHHVRLSPTDDHPLGEPHDGAPRDMISAYLMQHSAHLRDEAARRAQETAADDPAPPFTGLETVEPYRSSETASPSAEAYETFNTYEQERASPPQHWTTSALLQHRQQVSPPSAGRNTQSSTQPSAQPREWPSAQADAAAQAQQHSPPTAFGQYGSLELGPSAPYVGRPSTARASTAHRHASFYSGDIDTSRLAREHVPLGATGTSSYSAPLPSTSASGALDAHNERSSGSEGGMSMLWGSVVTDTPQPTYVQTAPLDEPVRRPPMRGEPVYMQPQPVPAPSNVDSDVEMPPPPVPTSKSRLRSRRQVSFARPRSPPPSAAAAANTDGSSHSPTRNTWPRMASQSMRELQAMLEGAAATPDPPAHARSQAEASSVHRAEQRVGEPYPRPGGMPTRSTSTRARGAEARLSSSQRAAPPAPLEGLQQPVQGPRATSTSTQGDILVFPEAGPSQTVPAESRSAPAVLTTFPAVLYPSSRIGSTPWARFERTFPEPGSSTQSSTHRSADPANLSRPPMFTPTSTARRFAGETIPADAPVEPVAAATPAARPTPAARTARAARSARTAQAAPAAPAFTGPSPSSIPVRSGGTPDSPLRWVPFVPPSTTGSSPIASAVPDVLDSVPPSTEGSSPIASAVSDFLDSGPSTNPLLAAGTAASPFTSTSAASWAPDPSFLAESSNPVMFVNPADLVFASGGVGGGNEAPALAAPAEVLLTSPAAAALREDLAHPPEPAQSDSGAARGTATRESRRRRGG